MQKSSDTRKLKQQESADIHADIHAEVVDSSQNWNCTGITGEVRTIFETRLL